MTICTTTHDWSSKVWLSSGLFLKHSDSTSKSHAAPCWDETASTHIPEHDSVSWQKQEWGEACKTWCMVTGWNT
eukprot:361378-Amphidinium_carterae.2